MPARCGECGHDFLIAFSCKGQGLKRLLRYCARPAFALERMREIDPEHLVYENVKPGLGSSVSLMLPHSS